MSNTLFQQTRDSVPMLGLCWAIVEDGGPTLTQYWVNVLCLLGGRLFKATWPTPEPALMRELRLHRPPASKDACLSDTSFPDREGAG